MLFLERFFGYLPIFYLILTAGLILTLKKRPLLIKPAVFLVIFLNFFKVVFLIFYQYNLWKNSEISKFLLPPYQPFSYFFSYVSYRFLLPFAFPLGVALIFYFLLKILNHFFKERLFYPEEPFFLFYAIIILAHPLWIFYIFSIIFLAIVLYCLGLVLKKIKFGELFSLYYLWLILTFVILLFNRYLINFPFIKTLKF